MTKVKNQPRRLTKVSSKNQVTLPVSALRESGLQAGDAVVVRADGHGRIVVELVEDVLARHRGRLTGVWEPGEIDRLRDEWER